MLSQAGEDMCKRCGRPVVWANWGRRRVALDRTAERRAIVITPSGGLATERHPGRRRIAIVDTYTVHHLTCPATDGRGRGDFGGDE